MTTVALWPQKGNAFSAAMLFGRSVWQRSLAAVEALKPSRILWIGSEPPLPIDSVSVSRLTTLRGTIVFVPASVPCMSASALKRVAKTSGQRPHALFRSRGGEPVVVAADGGELKRLTGAPPRSLDELGRRLKPEPVFTDDDDLLVVDSARAWSDAHRILRQRKLDALARRGVLVPDPSSVSVDPEVAVGAGTLLAPFVLIEGASRIGRGCTIGSFSHLVDTRVGAESRILDHCFLRESRIGKRASIGPFAHLRPESDVGDEARIGNFVELKKAKLGNGAKAPHLSYVGDATVGKNANLGAGTITCNYDGRVKNRTVVGDGAFIGSDVQLVAPVKIGKGAFVAAGSCIVEDVPANALALARSRQIVKRNWAKKRKK